MKALVRSLQEPAYFAQIVSVGGSATLTIASSWILSPDDRGRLAIVLLWMTLGSYVVSLGVPSQMLLWGTERNKRAALTFSIAFVPVGLACCSLFAIIVWKSHVLPSLSVGLFIVSSLGALAGALFNMASWYDYGDGHFVRSTVVRGVIPLSAFSSLAVAVHVNSADPLLSAAGTYVLVTALAVAWLTFTTGNSNTSEQAAQYALAIRNSLKYFAAQGGSLIWLRSPVLFSSVTQPTATTAVISLGLSVAELQGLLPQMRAAITFGESAGSADNRLKRHQLREVAYSLVPGAVAAVTVGFVMALSLPDAYSTLPFLVLILGPGVAALAVLGSGLNVLAVQGRTGVASVTLVFGLSVIFIFAWIIREDPLWALVGWSLLSVIISAGLLSMATRAPRAEPASDR